MTLRGNLQLVDGTVPTDDTTADLKTTAAAAASAANSQEKTGGKVGGLSLASDKMYIGTGTINNTNTGFYVDSNGNMSLKDKLYWNGTTLAITGQITSTSGTIGGFTMGSNVLYAGADGTRVSLSTADGIHLGHNTFGSAPFRVTRAGALTAESVTITGGSIGNSVTVGGTTATNVATYAGYANTINGYYSGGILDSVRGGTGLNNFSDSSYKNSSITYADILTANPSSTVVWTTADGASYSPTGLTQDIIVTYDGGTTTAACTVRWTYVNVSSSNADYLTSVAFQGSSTGFALGSPSVTLQSGVKYATVVVTHSASSETITLGALISQLVTGGGK